MIQIWTIVLKIEIHVKTWYKDAQQWQTKTIVDCLLEHGISNRRHKFPIFNSYPLPTLAVADAWAGWSVTSVTLCVCVSVARHALTRGQKVEGQGHMVMKCAAGVDMHVDMTAYVSSCMRCTKLRKIFNNLIGIIFNSLHLHRDLTAPAMTIAYCELDLQRLLPTRFLHRVQF